jgi:hypothetical protein
MRRIHGDCGRARVIHNDLINHYGKRRRWGAVAVAMFVLVTLAVWI